MANAQKALPLKSVTASAVLKLLEARHSKDVFVAECKDGSTHYTSGMVRMDAWAMPRSWAHPGCTGYEIKVSRSDFLNDEKWPRYLDLCNRLYFVAPAGVVHREEVPETCGLLEVSKNVKRLLTRKKAPHREVEIPEDLFRYVLMCRTEVVDEHRTNRPKAEFWKEWLAEKQEEQRTGWLVSRRISELVDNQVGEIEKENARLQDLVRKYEQVAEVMKEAGIEDVATWSMRRAAQDSLIPALRKPLEEARASITKALEAIDPHPDEPGLG